jgi:acetyl-CoA synthase
MTGIEIETIGQLVPVLQHARELLHPVPSDNHWTPYLGETLDGGMATLLAAEVIEAVRFVYGQQPEAVRSGAGSAMYSNMMMATEWPN